MKKLFSILLCLVIVFCPAFALAASKTTKVSILMYHHLSTNEKDLNSVTITPEKFKSDMQYLIDNGYNIVLPSELTAGGVAKKTVCVTFDDGYESNYLLAFPILKELNIKAEISVITSMMGKPGFLTWDECKEMEESGLVEIGSHTNNLHNPSTGGNYVKAGPNGIQRKYRESYKAFKIRVLDDITESYNAILKNLGHKPTTFSYPYGQKDGSCTKHIKSLFSVTLLTGNKVAGLKNNLHDMTRFGVNMDTELKDIL